MLAIRHRIAIGVALLTAFVLLMEPLAPIHSRWYSCSTCRETELRKWTKFGPISTTRQGSECSDWLAGQPLPRHVHRWVPHQDFWISGFLGSDFGAGSGDQSALLSITPAEQLRMYKAAKERGELTRCLEAFSRFADLYAAKDSHGSAELAAELRAAYADSD